MIIMISDDGGPTVLDMSHFDWNLVEFMWPYLGVKRDQVRHARNGVSESCDGWSGCVSRLW